MSRWSLLKHTSPSGKILFGCSKCGRESYAADKRCPAGCEMHEIGPRERAIPWSDPWSECLRIARSLERPAGAAGMVAMVWNGQLVLIHGQRRVWAATPGPDGWQLRWKPSATRAASTITVAGADEALDMIALACEGLARERAQRLSKAGHLEEHARSQPRHVARIARRRKASLSKSASTSGQVVTVRLPTGASG